MITHHISSDNTSASENGRLSIVWHKSSFNEIYCHSARLEYDNPSLSIFNPPVILVKVTTRHIKINKQGEESTCYDTTSSTYLPYKIQTVNNRSILDISLDSTPIISGLELDEWTKCKGGAKSKPIGFPTSLEITFGDASARWTFGPYNLKTPKSLSEKYLDGMSANEKINIIIHLNTN